MPPTPLGFSAPPPATEASADAAPQHNQMVRAPKTPDRNADGDVVNLGTTIDGRKGRDITVVCEAVYYRGIEYYAYACWDEPSEDIRPSIQQSTCILELKRCGSMYADFSLMTPHNVRTSKSRRFEGLIVGSDGLLCRREQKGPPDFATYQECFAVHECGLIMAQMVGPPRIKGGSKKMEYLSVHYSTC